MDTRSIATLLLKTTGLVLIVVCVAFLPGYIPIGVRGNEFSIGELLGAAALALGPLAILGALLWFFPGTVANKVVASTPADNGPFDTRPLELVALTVLGVFLVADGLIGAVRSIVLLIYIHRQDLTPVPASVVAHAVATTAELIIGVALCIGAKGVSRVIGRLRG
ncbi:hypothetical protein [Usitatibacter palustris]|uniref:hypothetical protein n=1 Tax=Usitatibacter palustris TaxID=2732487 RepID=UPI001487E7B5|nr:hypothetical protein [Usitatibacter palustris]